MQFIACDLPGLTIIEHDVFRDSRGYFLESYNKKIFHQNGLDVEFVQDNISFSGKGTLRGLHYQLAPHAQGKLVRVTQGQVYDVAVDIRRGSPTFGKWMGIELSAENHKALYIPAGFAHGFYVQSELAQFVYKCTNFFVREADRGILWSDPQIGIDWPERKTLILSDKDRQHPPLQEAEINFIYS